MSSNQFTISPIQLAHTYRALAAMYDAGVRPSEALAKIAEGADSAPLSRSVKTLSQAALEGESMSRVAHAFPNIFPAHHCAMLASGEVSGKMPEVFRQLADVTERDYALKQKIKQESLPLRFTLAFVPLPIIAAMIFLGVSWKDVTPSMWLALLAAMILLTWAFVYSKLVTQVDSVAETRYGPLIRYIPGIRDSGRLIAESQFVSVLASLYGAGVPPLQSLQAAVEATGSPSLRSALRKVVAQVRDGDRMSEILARSGALSSYITTTLAVGEESGSVPVSLTHIYRDQLSQIYIRLDALRMKSGLLLNVAIWGLGILVIAFVFREIYLFWGGSIRGLSR